MSKKVCPNCGHDKFMVAAIENHDWIVDGDGYFIEDKGCYEARRVDGTEWVCQYCCESVTPGEYHDPESDRGLSADQLDDKYNPDGGGEHPHHTREAWRLDVANENTITGYWGWVEWMISREEVE